MLRSVWAKSLRDARVAVAAWSLGLGLLVYSTFATAREVVGAGFAEFAVSFRFLAEPVAVDTVPGYVTFRVLSLFAPALLAVWALLAGARMVRGDEERGSLDVLLSTPRSRRRLLTGKLAALGTALLVVAAVLSLLVLAGQSAAGEPVSLARALGASLDMVAFAFLFAAAALLVSQVLPRQAAAGATGGLLAFSAVADATARTVDGAGWLRWLTPLHLYGANKPLIPGHPADPAAAVTLVGLAAVLAIASVALFARRDLGAGTALAHQPARRHGSRRAWDSPWLRSITRRALRAQAGATAWWLLLLAAFAGWSALLVPLVKEPVQRLSESGSVLAEVFGLGTGDAAFVAAYSFLFLPPAMVTLALTSALPFANDLDSGRLEAVLATPRSRARLLAERFGAVLAVAVASPVVIWLALVAGVRIASLDVGTGALAVASASIIPLELLVAALVFTMAGRLPATAAGGIAGGLIATSFLVATLQEALDLPTWVTSLSIFHQYGQPLVEGMRWGASLGMTGVAAALLALATLGFRRADLTRR